MPDGWAWSRLEPIASLITDYVANGSFASLKANVRTYKEKNYALFVRTVDFANNFKGDLSYIDKESYDFLEKSKLYGGELMLSNIGASIGKVFKVPHLDTPMSLAPNASILRFFNDITCDYFEYVFKSFVGQNYLQFLSGGAAMPKFNKTDLRAMIVPVPPIKEQERIVESVKNTFIGIDDLDISYSGLANTIQSVKSKILDLAIRGKLVPQDPNDEPASVLLERIRAEKEELIKQGKIKRDKKESVIFKGDDNSYYESIGDETTNIDDEIPFELPQNWEWSRLQTICYPITDGTHKTPTYSDTGYIFLSAKNITTGKINWNDVMYIPKSLHDELYSRISPQINDILLAKNGTTGVAAIVDRECEFDIYVTLALLRVISNNDILPQYLLKILASNTIQDYFNSSLKGIGVPNLHLEHIRTTLIPIPPINEQKRISKKVDQLFFLLDSIAKNAN